MAAPVTLGAMRTAARQRADMVNSQYVSDSEANAYINYSLSELYDELVVARGHEYFRKSSTFNTVGGQDTYPLPADFMQLTSCDVNMGGNLIMAAVPYNEDERNRFASYAGWYVGLTPVYYRIFGVSVKFIPMPTTAMSITLNYIPAFTPLVNDTDTFDGVNGWEEFAIWRATALMLAKEETDNSVAMGLVESLRTRIRGLAAFRNANGPEHVNDVYRQW